MFIKPQKDGKIPLKQAELEAGSGAAVPVPELSSPSGPSPASSVQSESVFSASGSQKRPRRRVGRRRRDGTLAASRDAILITLLLVSLAHRHWATCSPLANHHRQRANQRAHNQPDQLNPNAQTKPNKPAQPEPHDPNPNSNLNPNPNQWPDSTSAGFGLDEFADNEKWYESTFARNAIAVFVFSEWYDRNLSDSLDNSTDDLFGNSAERVSDLHPLPGPIPASGTLGDLLNESAANSNLLLFGPPNGSSAALGGAGAAGHTPNSTLAGGRPYFGDAFYSFQTVYWPIHCVICLVICTLGIFANVTNIIVLTRPNMITAVNTILSAMAFSDLIVSVSNIPYLIHELMDQTNLTAFFSYQWAVYILFQAHTTVTAHTISIWLTCVLSTWRYFVVCRSQSSNQRNWSVGLAKRTIIGVFLIVPVFCIPNYLSFSIVKETTETNATIYKVGFSDLADESQFIKTFHFWIFSCLTKLVPCVLLTFFTTVLIRKLLSARERRLRLATYGSGKELEANNKVPMPNGNAQRLGNSKSGKDILVNDANHHRTEAMIFSENNQHLSDFEQNKDDGGMSNGNHSRGAQQLGSSSATVGELVVTSCETSGSGNESANGLDNQQPRILSQLIVESTANSTTTISTSKAPSRLLGSSPDMDRPNNPHHLGGNDVSLCPSRVPYDSPRSASTCGVLEYYGDQSIEGKTMGVQPTKKSSMTASQDLSGFNCGRTGRGSIKCTATNPRSEGDLKFSSDSKRASEIMLSSHGRSLGSTTIAPFQMVKLQAAQRQLTQNETTTRLLIAVMIVFLICEFPAGILAALCAILGQDFFENVYQPTGMFTDLLALINSSVNFMIYCFMSTQFRVTFYRVVLHCPAPHSAPQTHTLVTNANQNLNPNNNSNVKERHPSRELNNY